MSSPQDQTVTPLPTAALVATTEQTLICQTEGATDSDRMSRPTYSVSIPESVTYTWSLEDNTGRVVFTSGASSTSYTRLLLPATPGVYVLKCKIDDPWADGQIPAVTGATEPETGSKNDAALVREVEVDVVKVKFIEDETTPQKYGFDAFTNRLEPWKSIELAQTDTAFAQITPPEAASSVHFMPSNYLVDVPSDLTIRVSPERAVTTPQKITVEGREETKFGVKVEANGGSFRNPTLGAMQVAVYAKRALTVDIVLVNEDSGGMDGEDIDKASIEAWLKKVYGQAVCEWKDIHKAAAPVVANYDVNGDGQFSATGLWSLNNEKLAVVRAYYATNPDSYDKVVFLLSKPNPANYGGVAERPGQYAFLFADRIKPSGIDPAQAVAHELGHCLGLPHTGGIDGNGLDNGTPVDERNVMHPNVGNNNNRLRKNQWDALHPQVP